MHTALGHIEGNTVQHLIFADIGMHVIEAKNMVVHAAASSAGMPR